MKHRRLAVDLSVEERPCAKIGRPSSTRLLFLSSWNLSLWAACLSLVLLLAPIPAKAQAPKPDWKAEVAEAMPLLGHRNWVLIVDSAYPLETARGIETVEPNADELSVVRSVLETINSSRHVRPVITLDSELAFVPDQDAPGVSAYRQQIGKMLQGYDVQSQPHDAILKAIDKEGKTFHVLVLKTNMAIPYTSVFIRLDCKYWSADAEKRLRAKMGTASRVKSKHDGTN